MRTYEIFNSTTRDRKTVATLYIEGEGADYRAKIIIADDARPADVPLLFALFLQRGEHEIPHEWAKRWLQEFACRWSSRLNGRLNLRSYSLPSPKSND